MLLNKSYTWNVKNVYLVNTEASFAGTTSFLRQSRFYLVCYFLKKESMGFSEDLLIFLLELLVVLVVELRFFELDEVESSSFRISRIVRLLKHSSI